MSGFRDELTRFELVFLESSFEELSLDDVSLEVSLAELSLEESFFESSDLDLSSFFESLLPPSEAAGLMLSPRRKHWPTIPYFQPARSLKRP